MLGSTILGAINGALGLGLGFGAFAGLSSAIAAIIGPAGWTAVGLVAIVKLGAPSYKKLLPVVVLIASYREATGALAAPLPQAPIPTSPVASDEALDWVALEISGGDKLYADLSDPEREKARQILAQRATQDSSAESAAMADDQPAQKPAKVEERQEKLAGGGIRKRADDLQQSYLSYFRHLAFLEPALVKLCEYDKNTLRHFERKFSVMNEGETEGKHNVPRTDPLVWQQDVGRDLRVYFRHDSYQNKIIVLLVGTKSSQEADYSRLRRRATETARSLM